MLHNRAKKGLGLNSIVHTNLAGLVQITAAVAVGAVCGYMFCKFRRRAASVPPASDVPCVTPARHDSGDFMLSVVDIIDEIELMKSGQGAALVPHLMHIQSRLRDKIELQDGELIAQNTWDSTVQRAVKAEPGHPGQTDILFVSSRATGLKHKGKIIRKQEVIVSKP